MSRYELLERIGAGGMAGIFRGKAIAAGGFEKPVAIKRILPHLSQDKRFVELLIAEAKILSQLRHRNIVQIFDVGLADDGQYFLVMEYVDGTDLGALFELLQKQNRRLPLDVALHIGAEVCEALDHAHRAKDADGNPIKLVHRDVSPSNILLSQSGEVKLTDFGIAKSIEESTGHGSVRGKFAYISPEQARNQHVDGRSDAYSLAICVYELVTGRRLYSSMSDFDALAVAREPKVVRIRDVDPALPEELNRLLTKALDRDPKNRFQSAAELGSALRTFRYSLDETSSDPAKAIATLVREQWTQWEEDDDERTVLRPVAADAEKAQPMEFADVEDEETHAVSLFGDAPITLSSRSGVSGAVDPMGSTVLAVPVPMRAGSSVETRPIDAPSFASVSAVLDGLDDLATVPATRSEILAHRAAAPAARPSAPQPIARPPSASAAVPVGAAGDASMSRFPTPHPGASTDVGSRPSTITSTTRGPSWKSVVVLAVLAAILAVAAFVVAGRVLSDDGDHGVAEPSGGEEGPSVAKPAASATARDNAAPALADAGVPVDAAAPEKSIVPAATLDAGAKKSKKKRRSRRRSGKRRRK